MVPPVSLSAAAESANNADKGRAVGVRSAGQDDGGKETDGDCGRNGDKDRNGDNNYGGNEDSDEDDDEDAANLDEPLPAISTAGKGVDGQASGGETSETLLLALVHR